MVELKKQYLSIYIVYIVLGLSLGLWEVFKPIWLIEKGLTIEGLGIIFFIALIMAAFFSILIGNKVIKNGIRVSIQIALIIRLVNFVSMLLISNKYIMIFQSCIDLLVDTLIIQWMYPLLTQIKINNAFFGLKDNLYDLASNIGTIVAGIFIGIVLHNFTSYQICIIICIFLFLTCFFLLFKVKNEKIVLNESNIMKKVLKIDSVKDYIKYSCSRRLQLFLILGFFYGDTYR